MARIIFADDDVDLGYMVQFSLQDAGHTVVLVSDGVIAREAIVAGEYDLIMLDVMMPKLDGFALCRELAERASSPPIMFVSARDRDADIEEGKAAGATDYLPKPFSLEDLLARVEAITGPAA